MKRIHTILLLLVLPFSSGICQASSQTLASTLEVYVFPAKGQAAQQQASAEQVGNFKKAFSVCLEAKSYMVKY
jgi:hypothetical protein